MNAFTKTFYFSSIGWELTKLKNKMFSLLNHSNGFIFFVNMLPNTLKTVCINWSGYNFLVLEIGQFKQHIFVLYASNIWLYEVY